MSDMETDMPELFMSDHEIAEADWEKDAGHGSAEDPDDLPAL